MRIGLDISGALTSIRATASYVKNLVKSLLLLDAENDYFLFLNYMRPIPRCSLSSWLPSLPGRSGNNVHLTHWRLPWRLLELLWRHFHLPSVEQMTGSVDLFHSPALLSPPQKKGKALLTLHGLAPFVIPELLSPPYVNEMRSLLSEQVKRVHHLITVSSASKSEITRFLSFPEERIHVVPLGVGEEFLSSGRVEGKKKEAGRKLRVTYGISSPFVLYVGALEAHKNLSGILEAFHQIQGDFPDHALVLAGEKGSYAVSLQKKVRELSLEKKVLFPGYIPHEEAGISSRAPGLPLLYSACDLFLFPSFYEGMASPPLEAMACGAPVLTSNLSSLPETTGGAACYVDPYNVEDIAEGIHKILSSPSLQGELAERGKEVARSFTWEEAARKTLRVYQEVAGHEDCV